MVKISIIIPTYNRAELITETVNSVLTQTFNDFEAIVVDDGSVDNTSEIIAGFKDPRVRYIFQANKGVSAARNTGIKASNGEYIAFVDSDDIWLPQNLEIKVKLLDSRPDIGVVCSDASIFDNTTGDIIYRAWHNAKGPHSLINLEKTIQNPLKELVAKGCFIGPPVTIIRRQVFDTVGFFDESLPSHEDWDLMVRIVRRFPIDMIDIPLIKVRRNSNSITNNSEKMYLGEVAVYNKIIRSGSLSKEEIKLLDRRLVSQHFWYGRLALQSGRKVAAIKAFIAGIRIEPWNTRLYVSLLSTVPGIRRTFALKKWGVKLRRHHQSS